MAETRFTFERIEKKWRMTADQFRAILPALADHLLRDEFGTTTIVSEFYDTPDFALIRNSIERPPFKEKLRVRSYGIPTDETKVFVEIKRKLNGVGYKRRITVPYADAKRLLRGEPINSSNPQIEREILEFVNRYHPVPVATLAYERVAMYDKDDPELRITIDRHIRYRTHDLDMTNGADGEPILNDDRQILMEVKGQGGIPLWLDEELTKNKIYRAPFSKIGTAYTNRIAPSIKY